MKRLFDKAMRDRHPLGWLGMRPVDAVRAAERRALGGMKAGRPRRTATAWVPVTSSLR